MTVTAQNKVRGHVLETFSYTKDLRSDEARAALNNGVLEITIPWAQKEEQKKKFIRIE